MVHDQCLHDILLRRHSFGSEKRSLIRFCFCTYICGREKKMKVKDSIDVVLGFKGFYFGFSYEVLDIDGHG